MTSLVPVSSTDGAMLEMLFTCFLPSRRWLTTLALGAQYRQGIPPRNWKQTWVKASTCVPDKSSGDFYANWMAYLSANDRKDFKQAAQFLEHSLEAASTVPAKLRDLVAQEAVVFSAWFRVDLDLARKWLLQVKRKHSLPTTVRHRIEVAMYLASGDFNGALQEWESGLRAIERMTASPVTKALKEAWIQWKGEIDLRQANVTDVSLTNGLVRAE